MANVSGGTSKILPEASPEFPPDVRPAIHTVVAPKGLPGLSQEVFSELSQGLS